MLIQISLQKRGAAVSDSFELSWELAKLGLEHKVFLSSENEAKDKWIFSDEMKDQCAFFSTYKGNNVSFLLATLSLKWLRILNALRYSRPNVILATHFHPWLFFVATFKRKLTDKFIYVTHEDPFHPKENDNFILLWLQKYVLKKADMVFTHSKKIESDIKPYLAKGIDVCNFPLGAYSHYFGDFIKKEFTNEKKFVFLGRIEKHKGVDLLAQAFLRLSVRCPSVHLTIAGSGQLPGQVSDIKKNIKIINRWLSDRDIVDVLSDADVLVLPYKEASQSGVMSTAWGFGIPIICSDVGGLVEQVIDKENGLIFHSGDYLDLENKMYMICNDTDLFKKITKGALYYGKEVYTWKAMAVSIKNIASEYTTTSE